MKLFNKVIIMWKKNI